MKPPKDYVIMAARVCLILVVSMAVASIMNKANAACRSQAQRKAFLHQNGYIRSKPGHVVDHICALACGGIDAPSNMQFQTIADSKAKDKWETTPAGCKKTCTPQNSTSVRKVFNCNVSRQ